MTPKKKATLLCILFAVVYCIHGISGPLIAMQQVLQTGEFVGFSFLGWYHILTLSLAAAVYLPLAVTINRLCKAANMKSMRVISLFVIIVLSAFVALNAIAIILWLINPGHLG